jgi:hypothetical protein
LFKSGRSGRPFVQARPVRKASCSGQAGQKGQLFKLGRSGRPVVQVRPIRKASSGQADQEGQLFRSGRSGRPVVQVRPIRNANQHISGFQEAESRRTYLKKSTNCAESAKKLNFGSCNVHEIISGLVYGLQKCVLGGCSVSTRLEACQRSLALYGSEGTDCQYSFITGDDSWAHHCDPEMRS